MTRSFLKELGLEADVIDKIIKEHGSRIEKFKNENADLLLEIKELKANNIDVEKAIKNGIAEKEREFKEKLSKYEKFEEMEKELNDLKSERNDRVFNDTLEDYFKDNKIDFTSNYAKEAIVNKIKGKNFEIKEGKFDNSLNDFMKDLRENEKEAFKQQEETTQQINSPFFYTPNAGGDAKQGDDLMTTIMNVL